jgi:RNA polymerase sigma-70 factor (ECF subfamily)
MRNASEKRFAGSPTTAHSLLRGLRATDQESWRRLVDVYTPLVLHWLWTNGIRGANAADVTQDVFAAVFLGLSSFDHLGIGSFRGWLCGITRNKICDFYRQRQDGPPADRYLNEADVRMPDLNKDELGQSDSFEVLYDALEDVRAVCEDRTWQAFYGVVLEERHPSDIAAELNMSVGAVYIAKSRVLKRLREALG